VALRHDQLARPSGSKQAAPSNDRPLRAASPTPKCATPFSRADKADREELRLSASPTQSWASRIGDPCGSRAHPGGPADRYEAGSDRSSTGPQPCERKAYLLADNKLALNGGWDREVLAIELQKLIDLGFDIEATGFALGEIEVILDEAAEGAPNYPLDGPRKMKFLSNATQRSQRRCVAGGGVTGWSAAMLATKRRTRRFLAMSAPT
jgi:hypothetical protein